MSDVPHDDSFPHSEVKTKCCPKCGETKPIEAFCKDKTKSDGLRSGCRACAKTRKATHYAEHRDEERARNATNYAANRDKRLAWQNAYYAAHREERRAYGAAYRAANPDKRAAYQSTYYAAHREEMRAYQYVYRRANRDKIHACNAAYYRANPHVRTVQTQVRRARKKGNGGAGFSPTEYKTMQQNQAGICAYCQLHYIDPLQIDHVIPLKQGGPHEAANIVLACADCNNEKRARTPEQWADRWYYYLNLGRMM